MYNFVFTSVFDEVRAKRESSLFYSNFHDFLGVQSRRLRICQLSSEIDSILASLEPRQKHLVFEMEFR